MSNGSFNGINLGDYCWVEISTEQEVEIHKIPRADGSILRRRGGGLKTINVAGWVKKLSRQELETYTNGLAAAFGSGLADLVVNHNTYSNCILKSISPGSDYYKWSRFNIVFYRSGD
jgi:hypothetical protein